MDEAKTCPVCNATCAHDAVGCSCGHVFAPPTAPPQVAYPRPGIDFAPPASLTIGERIIPTKNPKALIAYYCGVFSVPICFAPILGPIALILGILGLVDCNRTPGLPGKGHAITGIVLGGLFTLISYGLLVAIVVIDEMNRQR